MCADVSTFQKVDGKYNTLAAPYTVSMNQTSRPPDFR